MQGRILLILMLALTLAAGSQAHARKPSKRVLLLNSYHQNLAWSENILRGVSDVLRPGESGIELLLENMDTKRVEFSPEYERQLHEVYAHKYAKTHPDLILAADNNAFDFLSKYHEDLFKDVPVVFCGVNDYKPSMLSGKTLFTGVAEEVDAVGTVRSIMKLLPGTREIYIINDFTPTGRAWTLDIRRQLEGLEDEVRVTYAPPASIDSLLEDVSDLPADSVVLLGAYYRDSRGLYLGGVEAVKRISESSRVPVFGLLDFALGKGVVGGVLTSGYKQGQAMAQLGLLVLSGRKPSRLPVITSGLLETQYDYKQLKRFNLSLAELEPDSEIINRPRSFYDEHRAALLVIVAFVAIQMVVILILAVNMRRRKQAERSLRKVRQDLEVRVRERTSELKESEEALRVVFDSSHDAIIVHTPEGVILDANEGMLEMYGLRREDLPTLSIARDISSRQCPLHSLSGVWAQVAAGNEQTFEWMARKPSNGHEFHVEVHLRPILFRKRAAILANVRNISARKASENELRRTLSKLEAILDNSLMGIAMTRGDLLETINQRGAETFGYSPEEAMGRSWTEVLGTSEDSRALMLDMRDALESCGEFLTERELVGRNGEVSWCRMYAKAVDRQDLAKGVIWAWDDISDIKSAEDELRATREEALAANRAKSEFLAAMSHEIRTPMNAIVGMTEITLQTELTDHQRDYLRAVKDSADHLLQIINDILDLSKIEAKKLELDRVDFDLPLHLETTVRAMQVQASQKGLELSLEVADGVPDCVKGDPVCLRQVLVNLLGNAVKFTHKGKVVVRASAAQSPSPDLLGVHFEVEDSGIGIPDEFRDTIFQNFSQTTRAYGGTGLGLAICKELIALMGGDITVSSEVGRGSVFSFDAYFEPGVLCGVQTRHSLQPTADQEGLHILVAEDNPMNVMVTSLRLEEMGHTHEVAENGEQVLTMLRQGTFDLILMDVEMPVMDGLAATRAIRAATPEMDIPDPDIPIVAMTAHALKEFRDKCLEAGMDAYISKPVDFEELAAIISRIRAGSELAERIQAPVDEETVLESAPVVSEPPLSVENELSQDKSEAVEDGPLSGETVTGGEEAAAAEVNVAPTSPRRLRSILRVSGWTSTRPCSPIWCEPAFRRYAIFPKRCSLFWSVASARKPRAWCRPCATSASSWVPTTARIWPQARKQPAVSPPKTR
jgi:PAS domain S-box-containing protein